MLKILEGYLTIFIWSGEQIFFDQLNTQPYFHGFGPSYLCVHLFFYDPASANIPLRKWTNRNLGGGLRNLQNRFDTC